MEERKATANDTMVADAINDVMAEKPTATENINDFIERVSKKFLEKKLASFPQIVDVFIVQNKLKMQELQTAGNPKGWSESKDFKWDFDIPSELYYFMVNLVYRDFWEEENEKIWRPFLKALLRGDEPMTTLMKVKTIYGSTIEAEKAGII